MKQLRAAWRALRAIGHVLRGLWIIRSEFGRLTPSQTQLVVREWSRQMLTILGVELVVQGEAPAHGPLLMVSNHISWLDILVLNAAHPSRFVSKADVKGWPLLGSLITGAGTLYIERESRRDAMRVVHHMAERLRAGDILTVFPEGTTGDGRTLLPFSRQPAAGRDHGQRTGAAAGTGLCRQRSRRAARRSAVHWRHHAGGLDLVHPVRRRRAGPGALRRTPTPARA